MTERDYDSIQRKRNFIVGVFVLMALTALVWLIFRFGQLPVMVSKIGSYMVLGQFGSAPGVQENTPVRFCGYQIGRVTDIKAPTKVKDLDTGMEYYQVRVAMRISNDYKQIPSNAMIKLMKRGLGSSYLEIVVDPKKELVPLDPARPETKYMMDGMIVQGKEGASSEFVSEETQNRLGELLAGVTKLVANMNDIVGDQQNRDNLKATIANLKDATAQATTTLKQIEEFSKAGTKTAAQVGDALGQLSGSLAELERVLRKVNEGKGSAGRLVNDASLYESLLESSKDLDALIVELKLFVTKARDGGVPIKLK